MGVRTIVCGSSLLVLILVVIFLLNTSVDRRGGRPNTNSTGPREARKPSAVAQAAFAEEERSAESSPAQQGSDGSAAPMVSSRKEPEVASKVKAELLKDVKPTTPVVDPPTQAGGTKSETQTVRSTTTRSLVESLYTPEADYIPRHVCSYTPPTKRRFYVPSAGRRTWSWVTDLLYYAGKRPRRGNNGRVVVTSFGDEDYGYHVADTIRALSGPKSVDRQSLAKVLYDAGLPRFCGGACQCGLPTVAPRMVAEDDLYKTSTSKLKQKDSDGTVTTSEVTSKVPAKYFAYIGDITLSSEKLYDVLKPYFGTARDDRIGVDVLLEKGNKAPYVPPEIDEYGARVVSKTLNASSCDLVYYDRVVQNIAKRHGVASGGAGIDFLFIQAGICNVEVLVKSVMPHLLKPNGVDILSFSLPLGRFKRSTDFYIDLAHELDQLNYECLFPTERSGRKFRGVRIMPFGAYVPVKPCGPRMPFDWMESPIVPMHMICHLKNRQLNAALEEMGKFQHKETFGTSGCTSLPRGRALLKFASATDTLISAVRRTDEV